MHSCTIVVFTATNVIRLNVLLHPDDVKQHGSYIHTAFISEFQSKNQPVLSVLQQNKIQIEISAYSGVLKDEHADPLPLDIVQALQDMKQEQVQFTNRDDDIRMLVSARGPKFCLVDAPAGYGKTTLLRELYHRFKEVRWKCAYVSGQKYRDLLLITQRIADELEVPYKVESSIAIQKDADAKNLGQSLGEAIKKHWYAEYQQGDSITAKPIFRTLKTE